MKEEYILEKKNGLKQRYNIYTPENIIDKIPLVFINGWTSKKKNFSNFFFLYIQKKLKKIKKYKK